MNNINNSNEAIPFFDFFSIPHNPEEIFELLYLIGKGDYYELYKAIHISTGDIFCIKIIMLEKFAKKNENGNKIQKNLIFQKLKQEALIMRFLKGCDNINKYLGSYFSFKFNNLWLIYEYCPCGSVYDLIKEIERPLTEEEISVIINDILRGLGYMQQLNIIHRNLKMTNILINGKGTAKLSDFSKSVQILNNEFHTKKTKKDELEDIKYDMFFLGIICVEMFKGFKDDLFNRNLFIDKIKNNHTSQKKIIHAELNDYNVGVSNEFIDFIMRCLDPSLLRRPMAPELITHPFVVKGKNISTKTKFLELIQSNFAKIEFYKKEKYTSDISKNLNKKMIGTFYNSINSNTKNTVKSYISQNNNNNNNNNDKSSTSNLSNLINNNTHNEMNEDKLAEFRIEDLKRSRRDDNDKNSNKDLYSILDNTQVNNDESLNLNLNLKESAVFGRGEKAAELPEGKDKFDDAKKSLLTKSLFKKEKTNKNSINNYNEDIINFKKNLEKTDENGEKFKKKLKDSKLNYEYDYDYNNNHVLDFNDNDSFEIHTEYEKNLQDININNEIGIEDVKKNNEPNNININVNIPFSKKKCDVIQLGASVQKIRYSLKNNSTPGNSQKNSINKMTENQYNDEYKDNSNILKKKSLLSFKCSNSNNDLNLNEIDINNKGGGVKEKNSKNDISTRFASLNTPLSFNCAGAMGIILENRNSCKAFSFNKKNFDENIFNSINNNGIGDTKKSDSERKHFSAEKRKDKFLYSYLDEFEADKPKENGIKSAKSNIIKINKIIYFKKENPIEENIRSFDFREEK